MHGSYLASQRPPRSWPRPGFVPGPLGRNSRVHPNDRTRYRVTNGSVFDRALVQRGDITMWISKDAIRSWKPRPSRKRGGQRRYSEVAFETALTLRVVFNLPLRQAEDFLLSSFEIMGLSLEVPDHTTLSRRSQNPGVRLRRPGTSKPIHLIVDRTGLSIVGVGEWAAAKHGKQGKRGWMKWPRVPSGRVGSLLGF